MYIKVRNIREKSEDLIVSVSKTTEIEELRDKIFEELGVEPQRQRLLYKGKQLVDGHCIIDYNVQLNDVIQLWVTAEEDIKDTKEENGERKEVCLKEEAEKKEVRETDAECRFYQIGDYVDMRDFDGAWFEAKILRITQQDDKSHENELIFHVVRRSEIERGSIAVKFNDIRPQSFRELKIEDLEPFQTVLINYNMEEPKKLGYWHDYQINEIKNKKITGNLLLGRDKTPIEIELKTTQPIFRIETHESSGNNLLLEKLPLRKIPFNCLKCKDAKRKCRYCGCKVCFGKEDWDKILLCDECDDGYHIDCLDPPLEKVPGEDDDWFCPKCKNDENEIVKAGEGLKSNKKKVKRTAKNGRDWGKGMACVGRTKDFHLLPKDHVGSIPGVLVGTCWKFRMQLSEAGIHRPLVAGIHGRESKCAFSIVLSGGYEDDVDNGDEFLYTGSGGRDLSGNKRVSEQSSDQTLTRMNKALANNCNAVLNAQTGAEAQDWKKGIPVRVTRSSNASKHSKYAPKEGYRYDGIYKVVKYYREKGKSGYYVWRYLLRRDDPNPAPWYRDGKQSECILPDGYKEALAKEKLQTKSLKRGKKRALVEMTSDNHQETIDRMFKKAKIDQENGDEYKLDEELIKLIEADEINDKLWLEAKEVLKDGQEKFLEKLQEIFMCICCQELVLKPITTTCKHNFCETCLKRAFKLKMFNCPYCRFVLGDDCVLNVNENLSQVLLKLFPGYEASR